MRNVGSIKLGNKIMAVINDLEIFPSSMSRWRDIVASSLCAVTQKKKKTFKKRNINWNINYIL